MIFGFGWKSYDIFIFHFFILSYSNISLSLFGKISHFFSRSELPFFRKIVSLIDLETNLEIKLVSILETTLEAAFSEMI